MRPQYKTPGPSANLVSSRCEPVRLRQTAQIDDIVQCVSERLNLCGRFDRKDRPIGCLVIDQCMTDDREMIGRFGERRGRNTIPEYVQRPRHVGLWHTVQIALDGCQFAAVTWRDDQPMRLQDHRASVAIDCMVFDRQNH